ncbi:MAG: ATP-dependent helicase HrpB [Deinococcales bacterium]
MPDSFSSPIETSSPLPIEAILPELQHQFEHSSTLIVEAPPGAGKSTALPLFLLGLGKNIIMLEPRRLAARSVAARMAQLLGEKLGQQVGYAVRFERQVSSATRLLVLTEGLLTRRLQDDTLLEGIDCIIFDEFHERSLHADLALALCLEIQRELRPDLKIIIMSATLESEALAQQLGAVVLRAEGRTYPLEIRFAQKEPEAPIPNRVAQAVWRALESETGDILAFLPGASEIRRCQELLKGCGAEVLPLYSELSLEAQQRAILPSAHRRVVLATSIAETSLTIQGVRIVVDSGYARIPRFDPASSLTRLATVRLTQDAATQRAGRAGRTQAGVVYRLWTQAQHASLERTRKPEILESDLAPLALELAAWGTATLPWITAPNGAALEQAQTLLGNLGALEQGRITARGREMLRFPAHPRLAHLALAATDKALAADVCAILEERDFLEEQSADLGLRVAALRRFRRGSRPSNTDKTRLERVAQSAKQWAKLLGVRLETGEFSGLGKMLALAYPDRIAKLREGEKTRYKLALGRGVRLQSTDPLQGLGWLVVANLEAGQEEGKIFLCAALETNDLAAHTKSVEALHWDSKEGLLVARRERRIGELVLESVPLTEIQAEAKNKVLLSAVRQNPALLEWSPTARAYQARVQSLHLWRGLPFPDFSDQALLLRLEDWLIVDGVRRAADFARLDLRQMLEQSLPYEVQREVERLAPAKLSVPSGSQIRLEYDLHGAAPVLAVRLQEIFGWTQTPSINDGRTRVLMHLLSPAFRPVQVTQDLASFWKNTYPQVRKELKIKYPKHAWAEDPYSAAPVRGAVKRHS